VRTVEQGSIVAERYGHDATDVSMLPTASVGKAITSALIGLRIDDGVFRTSDLVRHPSWTEAEAEQRNIRSKHPMCHCLDSVLN
jgi:CubicO group peptidase (beta-lactamase class C family)